MTKREYITEQEASTLCGVSPSTLLRFAESGYLHTKSDSRGIRLFAEKEVYELFGKKQTEVYKENDQKLQSEAIKDKPVKPKVNPQTSKTSEINTSNIQEETPTKVAPLNNNKQENVASENQIRHEKNREKFNETFSSSLIEPYRAEVSRLKNLVDLQEKLLDQRDEEIKDLKKQRDWLQSRINKLDENREKDQLLLISETQMITKLLSIQSQRKSPLQTALEWIGIRKEEADISQTIEMKK